MQSTGDLLGLGDGDDGSVSVAGGAGGVKRSRSFLNLASPREPKVSESVWVGVGWSEGLFG